MTEPQPRVMDSSTWNPGVVWPVECLLNGINQTETHHVMFGGPSQMLAPQFRHRFTTPIHLNGASPHLVQLPGTLNLSLTSHTMVGSSGPIGETMACSTSGDNSQEVHGQEPRNIPMEDGEELEDSDEESDENCEIDDEDENDLSVRMGHGMSSSAPISQSLENENLVHRSGDGQIQDLRHITHHSGNMISMTEQQHLEQQQHSKQLVEGVGLMRNDIPPGADHSQLHNHGPPNPILMPMFVQEQSGEYIGQPPPNLSQNGGQGPETSGDNEEGDPNSGFSVYGKMYFEGRVVLHLKQCNESNGISAPNGNGSNFGSFMESEPRQQHKTQLHGCAVCRLRSPASQENHRAQKEAHRHTVKGVLFTFEDCIIVELYPEQLSANTSSNSDLKPNHFQNKTPILSQQIPISSFMPQPVQPLHQQQSDSSHECKSHRLLNNIDLNCPTEPHDQSENVILQVQDHSQHQQQQQEEKAVGQGQGPDHPSWWEEFESETGGAEDDEEPELPSQMREDESSAYDSSTSPPPDEPDRDHDHDPSLDSPTPGSHPGTPDQSSNNDLFDHKLQFKCSSCSEGFPRETDLFAHALEAHSCNGTSNLSNEALLSSHNTVLSLNEGTSSSGGLHMGSPSSSFEIRHPEDGLRINLEGQGQGTQNPLMTDPSSSSVINKTHYKLIPQTRTDNSIRRKSLTGKYPCPCCLKPFKLKKNLRVHLQEIHGDQNPFYCGGCFEHFTDKLRLEKHCCTGTNKSFSNRFKCESKDFGLSGELNQVKQENDGLRAKKHFRLQACESDSEENTGEDQGLKMKMEESGKDMNFNTSLNNGSSDKFTNSNSAEFSCDLCLKTFTSLEHLELHSLSHGRSGSEAGRSAQCDKCGKRFARRDKLMRHMFVHAEEKLFACELCSKRFSRRDKLADHLRSHGSIEESHSCPFCEKQFLRPDILKQHVKLHGMKNKHQCPECLRFVTGKDRLEKHMARHEEAKALGQPLLCPLCTKCFIQQQSLKAHLKKFHPEANFYEATGLPVESEKDSNNASATIVDEDNVSDIFIQNLSNAHRNGSMTMDSLTTGPLFETSSKPSFQCQICQRYFAKKETLAKHERIHKKSSDASQSKENFGTLNGGDKIQVDKFGSETTQNQNILNSSSLGLDGIGLMTPTSKSPSSICSSSSSTSSGTNLDAIPVPDIYPRHMSPSIVGDTETDGDLLLSSGHGTLEGLGVGPDHIYSKDNHSSDPSASIKPLNTPAVVGSDDENSNTMNGSEQGPLKHSETSTSSQPQPHFMVHSSDPQLHPVSMDHQDSTPSLHYHLGQQMSMTSSEVSHSLGVSISASSSSNICGPSYVLTHYPHFPYQ